eukprot:TRINITY_DN1110_c0_g2_i2.p1 TRINITY_DN1110_c0_g2~~TRINITY_DN1110_c0_g2_i2.p1  ORF type:complete len:104 (-),score=11.42 TRINITY_DN1110_c0_g2_i2:65-376(-)
MCVSRRPVSPLVGGPHLLAVAILALHQARDAAERHEHQGRKGQERVEAVVRILPVWWFNVRGCHLHCLHFLGTLRTANLLRRSHRHEGQDKAEEHEHLSRHGN